MTGEGSNRVVGLSPGGMVKYALPGLGRLDGGGRLL
jgi:hypothetical protein